MIRRKFLIATAIIACVVTTACADTTAPAEMRPSFDAASRPCPAQAAGCRELSTCCMTPPCSPFRWPAMQIRETPVCSTRWTFQVVHYDPPQTSHRHRDPRLCGHHRMLGHGGSQERPGGFEDWAECGCYANGLGPSVSPRGWTFVVKRTAGRRGS